MYVCTPWIASEPDGCGPKATSLATWSYALAPSNPPVCAAAGATSVGGMVICAGFAVVAEEGALTDALGRAESCPQAPANTTRKAAETIQDEFRKPVDTIQPPARRAHARACGAEPRTTPAH